MHSSQSCCENLCSQDNACHVGIGPSVLTVQFLCVNGACWTLDMRYLLPVSLQGWLFSCQSSPNNPFSVTDSLCPFSELSGPSFAGLSQELRPEISSLNHPGSDHGVGDTEMLPKCGRTAKPSLTSE